MQENNVPVPVTHAINWVLKEVPTIFPENTINDAHNLFLQKAQEFDSLEYLYVLNHSRHLVGFCSIKQIFQHAPTTKIQAIMKTDIITARSTADQEEVATLALRNELPMIPIIAKDNTFLGIVPFKNILKILHAEHVEDFLLSVGIHSKVDKALDGSIFFFTKARLPWLVLGLFGGIAAAYIVDIFEGLLTMHFMLAAFIPLIVYIADAVGTQTETLFIRSIALNSHLDFKRYVFREIITALLLGLALGTVVSFLTIFIFHVSYLIGIVLGLSLFLTVLTACIIGFTIPYILGRFRADPALGSGPFATIITDITSLTIYFLIAYALLTLK